ncbi:protein NDRG4 isoform X8 [Elephas maximus indicus]|uniref:protein NDRG4 isoform X8 n=1 Tax=Elephas maximus indicus TaxID=99487 RepID=UPI002115EA83|nr:protein NDRG4 isoform X8 [Elephas maximus indicus]
MKVLGHKIELLTGLLLHDVTMAGLQELRFPEEKPLLRGQDATELENSDAFLLTVDTDWKPIWEQGLRASKWLLRRPAGRMGQPRRGQDPSINVPGTGPHHRVDPLLPSGPSRGVIQAFVCPSWSSRGRLPRQDAGMLGRGECGWVWEEGHPSVPCLVRWSCSAAPWGLLRKCGGLQAPWSAGVAGGSQALGRGRGRMTSLRRRVRRVWDSPVRPRRSATRVSVCAYPLACDLYLVSFLSPEAEFPLPTCVRGCLQAAALLPVCVGGGGVLVVRLSTEGQAASFFLKGYVRGSPWSPGTSVPGGQRPRKSQPWPLQTAPAGWGLCGGGWRKGRRALLRACLRATRDP